jgi:hypothetical protein
MVAPADRFTPLSPGIQAWAERVVRLARERAASWPPPPKPACPTPIHPVYGVPVYTLTPELITPPPPRGSHDAADDPA